MLSKFIKLDITLYLTGTWPTRMKKCYLRYGKWYAVASYQKRGIAISAGEDMALASSYYDKSIVTYECLYTYHTAYILSALFLVVKAHQFLSTVLHLILATMNEQYYNRAWQPSSEIIHNMYNTWKTVKNWRASSAIQSCWLSHEPSDNSLFNHSNS